MARIGDVDVPDIEAAGEFIPRLRHDRAWLSQALFACCSTGSIFSRFALLGCYSECSAGVPSGEDSKKESVSARALDNIMKLLTSQIALKKRSKNMEVCSHPVVHEPAAGVAWHQLSTRSISCARPSERVVQGDDKKEAERRMADIDETLGKLIAVAKKRKYISADNTAESLRQQAERKVQDQAAKATVTRLSLIHISEPTRPY